MTGVVNGSKACCRACFHANGGELLRNLIITGLALHTMAPELPRLLANMPVPPASVSELQALILQMAGSGITEAVLLWF